MFERPWVAWLALIVALAGLAWLLWVITFPAGGPTGYSA